METTKAKTGTFPYDMAIGVGLVIMALRPLATMALDQQFNPVGLFFVLIPLALLGLVLTRNRWLMIVVVSISTVLFLGGTVSPIVQARLSNPAATGYFLLELVDLLANAVVIVAGLSALMQGSIRRL